MTHLTVSFELLVVNSGLRPANIFSATPLKYIQIKATLHPTGERNELRWGESRSEGGRQGEHVLYVGMGLKEIILGRAWEMGTREVNRVRLKRICSFLLHLLLLK